MVNSDYYSILSLFLPYDSLFSFYVLNPEFRLKNFKISITVRLLGQAEDPRIRYLCNLGSRVDFVGRYLHRFIYITYLLHYYITYYITYNCITWYLYYLPHFIVDESANFIYEITPNKTRKSPICRMVRVECPRALVILLYEVANTRKHLHPHTAKCRQPV